jgi:TRAP-type mannitol/chloroaromatic compound transport system substrate-binding protein
VIRTDLRRVSVKPSHGLRDQGVLPSLQDVPRADCGAHGCHWENKMKRWRDGKAITLRRRDLLVGSGLLVTEATLSFPAPVIAQGIRKLKMVTDWPAGSPGLQASAERLAQAIAAASAGRIMIDGFLSGTLVRPFETFDAVGAGVADMYHSADYYWEKKSPAFSFFAAVPFGFTADELAWMEYGGGQELWNALSGQHNIKPLLCLNTGVQMGGWFNRELTSLESLKGLRYRMPGLGGEVLRRLGATVLTLPGSEISQAFKSGAIDASEWVGPWLDMALGLHKAASYYYYPGFHEPSTGLTLGINKPLWESLDASDRRLIAEAAAAEYTRGVAEFSASLRTHWRCALFATKAPSKSCSSTTRCLRRFSRRARTLLPKQAKATSFRGKFPQVTSSSAH